MKAKTDYSSRIMNIPKGKDMSILTPEKIHYKVGHSDARHAAAEIAMEAESVIDDFINVVESIIPFLEDYASFDCKRIDDFDEFVAVLELLDKHKVKE